MHPPRWVNPTRIFFDENFFRPTIFFDPKIFFTQNFFWPITIFVIENKFLVKEILSKIVIYFLEFGSKKFWVKKILGWNICGLKNLWVEKNFESDIFFGHKISWG